MHASQVTDNNNGYLWVVCSFAAFVCFNFTSGFFVPSNAKRTAHHVWKWKNIATSLLHSCITGFWSVFCFLQAPEMKDDLINNYSRSAQAVICLSVGYFFYDLLDMGIHAWKRSFDLLIHHCLVISCFGLSVCTHYYQGYSLVALLVEVNSIFLHLRQLMLLYGVQKSSQIYQLNGILNLATFVVFRVFAMGGMFHWLLTHRADLTITVFCLGVFSLIVIMGMNFQLVFRVWKSDYRKKPQNPGHSPKKMKEELKHQTHLPHPDKLSNGECVRSSQQDVAVSQNGDTIPLITGEPVSKTNGKILKHD